MFGLGMQELMIIGVVAVLLFGRKLPEVARSLGSSYREFKKGLSEFHSHMDVSDTYTPPSSYSKSYTSHSSSYDDYDYEETTTAPKFEPPPAEPQAEADERTRTDSSEITRADG